MKKGKIEIKNLNVIYNSGSRVHAVKDLNLNINSEEFVCLIGPSGCGKSSIINAIAGFIKPSSGSILMDSEPIDGPSHERGVVFQNYILFPWKNVRGNIAFGLKQRSFNKEEINNEVSKYIKMVFLDGFEDYYPQELSGGMQQRVGLARVLINNPKIMLMDEPFGSVDAHTKIALEELLLEIWEKFKTTIIFSTHDIEEAILLADRVIVLTDLPARIKKEVVIDLPRPRNYRLVTSKKFIEIKEKLLNLLK